MNFSSLNKISKCLKILSPKQNINKTFRCLKLLAIPVACSPIEKLTLNGASKLNHEFLLKQSAVVLVSSVTSLLDNYTNAILDCYKEYTCSLEELLYLYEERHMVMGLGNTYLEDQVWDKIIAAKSTLEEVKKKSMNLELQISSVTNLANTTAEVSFGAGADYAAIAINERIISGLAEIERRKQKLQRLEHELIETEAKIVEYTVKKQQAQNN